MVFISNIKCLRTVYDLYKTTISKWLPEIVISVRRQVDGNRIATGK